MEGRGIKISYYNNTRELGRVLSHNGVTAILYVINEGPKQYKDIKKETKLPNSTLEDCLNGLKAIKIIDTRKISSNNRDTHQYHFTPIGKELLRFIKTYERTIKIPESQQQIIQADSK